MDERVRVGILGCGHVGGALVRLIHDHADVIEARAGVPLEVTRVAVHDLTKDRDLPLPSRCFTDDAGAVVDDPDVDIVVEVIGGIEPARRLIVEALMGGKPVVTANKELVATHGRELFETAEGAGVDILFEASVGGGIPLIRPLRESLAGDRIRRVMGIVNGTTNYILTRMTDAGASFADALAEAQALGFAETDPTADVEGFDAAAKAAIIASIAFGARVVAGDVYREGITEHHRRRHRVGARPRLRREAARDRRRLRRRDRGARAPGDGARAAPAGVGARLVQRGVHRGRRGGRAHALRPRRRRHAHRVGGARRPRRRGEEPGGGAQGRHHRHDGARARSAPSRTWSRSSTC